jgi:hypothetical protein
MNMGTGRQNTSHGTCRGTANHAGDGRLEPAPKVRDGPPATRNFTVYAVYVPWQTSQRKHVVAQLLKPNHPHSAASSRMTLLSELESGLPDRIIAIEPPPEICERLQQIAADRLFQASFSAMRTALMIVDIDQLVAPQRVGLARLSATERNGYSKP